MADERVVSDYGDRKDVIDKKKTLDDLCKMLSVGFLIMIITRK